MIQLLASCLQVLLFGIGLFVYVLYSHNMNPQGGENILYLKSGTVFFPVNAQETELLGNPFFSLVNKTTDLPSYWKGDCGKIFECKINTMEGWFDKLSFEISTDNTKSENWSEIHSNEIQVKPYEIYEIQGHLKLSNSTTQSHIVLEGFNESSRQWYQIIQCPPGVNGPLDWKEVICKVIIPPETKTIDVVLNAGWSSQPGQKAVTLFDAIHVYKSGSLTETQAVLTEPRYHKSP